MSVKLCPDCNKIKSLDQYYRDKSKKFGVTTYCKTCSQKRDKERYGNRKERSNQVNREYYQKHREQLIEKNRKYVRENKEIVNAQNQLKYAVKTGKLKRPNKCDKCQTITDDIHAHHEDYSKPLEVMWICRSCHRNLHIKEGSI